VAAHQRRRGGGKAAKIVNGGKRSETASKKQSVKNGGGSRNGVKWRGGSSIWRNQHNSDAAKRRMAKWRRHQAKNMAAKAAYRGIGGAGMAAANGVMRQNRGNGALGENQRGIGGSSGALSRRIASRAMRTSRRGMAAQSHPAANA